MKVVMIHGQSHKGITYTMSQHVLKYLEEEDTQIREFFLPADGPSFCVGCYSCFLNGEESCPQSEKTLPIMRAMEAADIIMLDTPNYCMEMSGAMKNLLDHFAYRWVTHRPHASMFAKVGVTLSSSAGAPPKGTVKSLSKQLKWMCVSKVYTFPLVSNAMGVGDLSDGKKRKIENTSKRLAKKIRRAAKRKKVSLRSKFQFMIFRCMQMGEKSGWNPTDKIWWEKQGWTKDKRPWR